MGSSEYDWTQFTKQVFINADVERVFRSWVVPREIVLWFISEADYTTPEGESRPDDAVVQPGDHYHWCWHQALDTAGSVLRVEDNALFEFTFGDRSDNTNEKIVVRVTFQQLEDVTMIELTQYNMGDTLRDHAQWHLGCNLGWSFFMTNLKARLEHGVDLREKDRDRAYASRAISH